VKITVAHASVPAAGERENGDKAIYRAEGSGHLVAVVDGLGHGAGAHEASSAAEAYLASASLAAPLSAIMEGIHDALSRTRGAAATVCLLRPGKIEVCAVGNVELRSGRLRLPLVASPGVLGTRVAKFRICETVIEKPARIILFSDGISSRVRFEEHAALTPKELCQHTMSEHRRDYDDCTILVADIEIQS
jgi:negative regulator of sigma-B (phosphoserine phosphatase)